VAVARRSLVRAFAALESDGLKQMAAEGFSSGAVQIRRSLDVRYAGQSYELNVPFAGNFISAFHRAHEKRYGYFNRSRLCEVVNVRARFMGRTPKPVLRAVPRGGRNADAAKVSISTVMFRGRAKLTAVYDRAGLRGENQISGPAIVTEYSATTLIPPDWAGRVDRIGNLILEPR
jgi:N-methylhydantoinase A